MTIRLMIIDDHELVRRGLVQFLGSSPGIKVVAEAASGKELLDKLCVTSADLLLLDMDMPGKKGADLIGHIRKIYPEMLILVLSMHDEPKTVIGALEAGASGYICKNSPPHTLLEAIHEVIASGKYLSHSMAAQLAYVAISSDPAIQ